MTYVAVWTGIAVLVIVFQLLTHGLIRRRGLPDDAERLRGFRQLTESFNGVFLISSFALVALVGGIALVARGETIGYAWFVPAALFSLSAVESERHRRWLKAELGDRGHAYLSGRGQRRKRISQGFLAFGAAGWLSNRLLKAALGPDQPEWALLLTGLFSATFLIGAVGWLATRTLSYAQGDDLHEPRS